ncbi:Xaa-Pro aminopeptidase [Antricoccus suffuscus]|uniref:Xaa-Pro aminopeptidase n=1 Tax=Antricoccus suffuscus TaxID=1629062 RepID=A0A2T1A0K7_9ACTN|nr:Xaa-Pro peptidase family protein [Antricoccus suffuscus]PRZ42135.1 Xaa-Pro aminopeptidase [Antricoccus suffuscus]
MTLAPDSPEEIRARLDKVARLVAESAADAVVLTPGADLRYLTGYDAMLSERLTCLVVPASGTPMLIAPTLEKSLAAASVAAGLGVEVRGWDETDNPSDMVVDLVPRPTDRPRAIAVADRMWAQHLFGIHYAAPDAKLTSAATIMAAMRMVKSEVEVEALARAGDAIDSVHAQMGELLKVGMAERQVAHEIAAAIRASGHATVDFTIVGSGPNGASPHHEYADRVISAGDVVVVDIGGTMPDGYCSDSTRTYVVGGEPTKEVSEFYDVLQSAQEAAVQFVRPGVTAEEIDATAREIITTAGHGEHFLHRTGHGIGLEVHEHPYIVEGNDRTIEAGMAFSIEPGIYLEGRYGARIEDIVVCTDDSVRRLNNRDHALVALPG